MSLLRLRATQLMNATLVIYNLKTTDSHCHLKLPTYTSDYNNSEAGPNTIHIYDKSRTKHEL